MKLILCGQSNGYGRAEPAQRRLPLELRGAHLSSLDLPAIAGGEPFFPDGPPRWPLQEEAIHGALEAAWSDGSWGTYHGPHVERLEAKLAALHEVEHAYCCSSGTLAIELALRGLRVGEGDEVLLAGYDFPGNFRAIERTGATPVLVDIAQRTWGLDAESLDTVRGDRVRAIIVSHLHGWLAPMPDICAWAADRGISVVEDACQAHGAQLKGKTAGAWGDVGVLSFGGSKLVTAGRGGAVLTDDPAVQQRIKIHCEQGNHAYPLSQLQAAVLAPQIDSLQEYNRQRDLAVGRMAERLSGTPGLYLVRAASEGSQPSYYKAGWWFEPLELGDSTGDELIAGLKAEGLAFGPGFAGFANRSPRRCRKVGSLDGSRAAADRAVLLHHPILMCDEQTIDRAADAIKRLVAYLRSREEGRKRVPPWK